MSKYAVRYWSQSKEQHVDIEAMHSGHLLNAWRKLAADKEAGGDVNPTLFAGIEAEVKARGLDKPREEAKP